jgi:uncharacterized repeat protein (TIGR02543 family)
MNSTEIKINNLLSVISSRLERSTLYKQMETIISEMNVLMSKALYNIAPTDERYTQVAKLNAVLHELSMLYTNPQTERNSKAALITSMLEECVDVIQALSFYVAYDSNGGSDVDTEEVHYGAAAHEPIAPTKESNVFRGWFTDNTTFLNAYNFATLVYDAKTLYAKWLAAVTLSFNEGGGSTVADQIIGTGELAIEPDAPTKELNVFRGWFNEVDSTTPFVWTTPITANKTAYAKWLTARTVTFNDGGGYAEPPQVIGTGEKVVRPDDEDQVKAGFQFINWFADASFTELFDFDEAIVADTTIYAKYLEKFAVSYQSNGGTEVAGEIVLDGELATEPAAPTKTGKTFGGWYTDDDTFATLFDFDNNTITADITLFAKWV